MFKWKVENGSHNKSTESDYLFLLVKVEGDSLHLTSKYAFTEEAAINRCEELALSSPGSKFTYVKVGASQVSEICQVGTVIWRNV